METEHEPRKRRKPIVWITIGLAIALSVGGVLATLTPSSPFPFLNKYKVSEARASKDGKLQILVLKADVADVWADIRHAYTGKRMFTSTGITNNNGLITEYRSIGTEEGLIKISNDLSFANEGFGTEIMDQNVKPGYCAVAFTRPKTALDRAIEWVRKTLGGSSKPPAPSTTVRGPRHEYELFAG